MRRIDKEGKDFTDYFQRRLANNFIEVYKMIENLSLRIKSNPTVATGWDNGNEHRNPLFIVPEQTIIDEVGRHMDLADNITSLGFALEKDYTKLYKSFKSVLGINGQPLVLSEEFFTVAENYIARHSGQLELGI